MGTRSEGRTGAGWQCQAAHLTTAPEQSRAGFARTLTPLFMVILEHASGNNAALGASFHLAALV